MRFRRGRLAVVLAGAVMAGAAAIAGAGQAGSMKPMATGSMTSMNEFKAYSTAAFDAAKAEGKTTVLFFHAPWCPVCRAQEPKLTRHLNGDARNVVAFKVDYDSNTALRKALAVEKQSTLIMYQGQTEVARLSYKSDDASIDAFFSHAKMAMSGSR
jgi:thiol-disulfide isomerase/thioredoxin